MNKTPLRISFSGGGTDIKEVFEKTKGNVLNATINFYVYSYITITKNKKINFISKDLNIKETYQKSKNNKLLFHKSILDYIFENFKHKINKKKINLNYDLSTFSEVPPGTGLGSSSALVVSILEILLYLYEIKLSAKNKVQMAYHIERVICNQKGGYQDYFSSVYGGILFLTLYKKNLSVDKISISQSLKTKLEASCIIIDSATSRDSYKIIKDQIRSVESKLNNFKQMAKYTKSAKIFLKSGNLNQFFNRIKLANLNKEKSSKKIMNLNSKKIINTISKKVDLLAYKISGAGGGGFIMIYFKPIDRSKVINCLNDNLIPYHSLSFTNIGSKNYEI